MAGPDRLVTIDSKCQTDKLRQQQHIFRVATTRLLKAANELLEAPSPSPHDLQVTIFLLESKDATMCEIDQKIIDILDYDEVEREYFEALAYRGDICRALNRLRNALKVSKASGMRGTTNATNTKFPSTSDHYVAFARQPIEVTLLLSTYIHQPCKLTHQRCRLARLGVRRLNCRGLGTISRRRPVITRTCLMCSGQRT